MSNTDMRRDLTLLFLRVCLGAIFIYHARMKLGWTEFAVFWQHDSILAYSYTQLGPFIQLVVQKLTFLPAHIAEWLAVTAALVEYIGGWALLAGLFTRTAALLLCIMMSVAIYFHLPYGFDGAQGGFEWAMLCLAGCQMLLMGPGYFSVEQLCSAITTAESQA